MTSTDTLRRVFYFLLPAFISAMNDSKARFPLPELTARVDEVGQDGFMDTASVCAVVCEHFTTELHRNS